MKTDKFKKLIAGVGLIVATTLLASCEDSANNLKSKANIGVFQGYEVEFVRDKNMDSRGLGLYVFHEIKNPRENLQDSTNLKDQGVIGKFEGNEIHFIRDSDWDSRGVGFYAIKKGDKLEPINGTFTQKNSKTVASIGSIIVKDNKTIEQYDLDKMSVAELMELNKLVEKSIKYKQKNEDNIANKKIEPDYIKSVEPKKNILNFK